LIAPRTQHTGNGGEGKLLLGGGYLADLRSSGTAGCIGNRNDRRIKAVSVVTPSI